MLPGLLSQYWLFQICRMYSTIRTTGQKEPFKRLEKSFRAEKGGVSQTIQSWLFYRPTLPWWVVHKGTEQIQCLGWLNVLSKNLLFSNLFLKLWFRKESKVEFCQKQKSAWRIRKANDADNNMISGPEAQYLSRYIMRIVGPAQEIGQKDYWQKTRTTSQMCNIFGISASKILVSLPQCSLCEKPMFLQVNIAGKQVLGDFHYHHH